MAKGTGEETGRLKCADMSLMGTGNVEFWPEEYQETNSKPRKY